MSENVLENLLAGVGRSDEELRDPRENDHEATIKDVRLVSNSPTAQVKHAIVVSYGDLVDTEGREFSFDDRVNLPAGDSADTIKRMFQGTLHSLGLVPYEDRRAYFADTEEERSAFVEAFKSRIGSRVPITIKIDKNGWPRLRVRRQR